MDRTGQVYEGAITPDEFVPTDWMLFGTEYDPVILAATDWLLEQSGCTNG
jgi:hypothetical protein